MPGLWGVGEISGGFFAFNYPGGSGLPKGAVFGRIAGRDAALKARESKKTSPVDAEPVKTNGVHKGHDIEKPIE